MLNCIINCLNRNLRGTGGQILIGGSFIVAFALAMVATGGNVGLSFFIAGVASSGVVAIVATWCYFTSCARRA